MALLAQGSTFSFSAPTDGATVTLSVNGGCIASWSGAVSGVIGPVPGRIVVGPLNIGQSVVFSADIGSCMLEFGDATPNEFGNATNAVIDSQGRLLGAGGALDFGLVGNGSDESATIQAAVSAAKAKSKNFVSLGGRTAHAPTVADDGDVHYFDGEITGRYGKRTVPESRSSYPKCVQIDPSQHLRAWSAAGASAIATVVGDSTSTQFCNANQPRDTLLGMFEAALHRDNQSRAVSCVSRGIGGTTFANLNTGPGTTTPPYSLNSLYSFWYTNASTDWLNYVQATNPDLLLIHFGMNDKQGLSWSAMVGAIAKIRAWSKVPDIVFGTALQPTSVGSAEFADDIQQDGRDMAAGLVRTYAQMFGYGLLDFNRAYNLMVRGLDPVGTYTVRCATNEAFNMPYEAAASYQVAFSDRKGGTVTRAVSGSARDYAFELVASNIASNFWDPSGNGTNRFKIRLSGKLATVNSALRNDLIVWRDSGTGRLFYNIRMDMTTGPVTHWLWAADQDSGITAPTSGNITLRFQLYDGGQLKLSLVTGGIQEQVIINRRVCRFGGVFRGFVGYDGTYTGYQPATITYFVGESNRYTPGAVSSDVWGDDKNPDFNDQVPFGGNGVNHPNSMGAGISYSLVLSEASFSPAVSTQLQAATAANIAASSSAVNQTGKTQGRQVWDSTNNRVMISSGNTPTSAWFVSDGSASVTPA